MCISFFFCSTPLPPHIHIPDFHEREPIEVETDIYQSLVEIKVRCHWILCRIPTGVICPLFHFSADRFLCRSWAPCWWWHWCRKVRVCMLFVFVVFLFFFSFSITLQSICCCGRLHYTTHHHHPIIPSSANPPASHLNHPVSLVHNIPVLWCELLEHHLIIEVFSQRIMDTRNLKVLKLRYIIDKRIFVHLWEIVDRLIHSLARFKKIAGRM